MAFSNILDISSFFIGMLINLLLIALICYYFKRKYEALEVAQNEQAKILYNIIQQQQNKKTVNIENLMNSVQDVNLDKPRDESDSDSDSDSDSESEKTLRSKSKRLR
jgi:type VI protein secretion system component VasK